MKEKGNYVPTARPRGRPRDEAVRQAIFDAAFQLERRKGYASVTLKEVAETAKVSRKTIYRWWPTKRDLYFEVAINAVKGSGATIDINTIGLEEYLSATFQLVREKIGTMTLGLLMEAQADRDLLNRLMSIFAFRREWLRIVTSNFASYQQKEYAVPVDIVVDMILGAMWYRLLMGSGTLDDAFAHELTLSAGKLFK